MMQHRRIALAAVLNLILAGAASSADTYLLDPVHTWVGFSVRHMVLANVRGRFTDFAGTIVYDEQDISRSSVNVTIKVPSVNTENQQRDDDLRSANFFDAAKHPEIAFKSSRIARQGDGYICYGTLTIKGVSREIALSFTLMGKVKDPWGKYAHRRRRRTDDQPARLRDYLEQDHGQRRAGRRQRSENRTQRRGR